MTQHGHDTQHSKQHSTQHSIQYKNLTLAQTDIYYHQQQFADLPLYDICFYSKLCGPLDLSLLEKTHQHLMACFDAFSMRVSVIKGEPKQSFAGFADASSIGISSAGCPLSMLDLSEQPQPQAAADNWIEANKITHFQLIDHCLLRADVLKLDSKQHWYVLRWHHLVGDGVSSFLLLKTFERIYNALLADDQQTLTSIKQNQLDYQDIIDAQRQQPDQYPQRLQYWRDKYANLPEPLFQTLTKSSQIPISNKGKSKQWISSIKSADYQQWHQLAKSCEVTLNQLFIAVLCAYFARVYERDELAIGLPVHNRKTPQQKAVFGMFSSVIPAKFNLNADLCFVDMVKQLRQQLNQDRQYLLHHGQINQAIGLAKTDRQRTFDLCFNFHQFNHQLNLNGLHSESYFPKNDHEQVPLHVYLHDLGDSQPVELVLDYNLAYWTDAEIQCLPGRIHHLFEQLVANPELPLKDLQLLPAAEQQQCLNRSVAPISSCPELICIHHLVEQQAQQQPHAAALSFDDHQLSYQTFNQQANQLAHYLKAQGVEPGELVGLCLPRSVDLIVAVLAILKLGAAYVPLDIAYPQNRLDYMLDNSGAKLLLTNTSLSARFAHSNKITLDDVSLQAELAAQPNHNLTIKVQPNDLAYVIYTSGSTGVPKGVKQNHQTITNLVYAQNLNDRKRTLQFTPSSFDVSIQELATSWYSASCLVLIDQATKDNLSRLPKVLIEQQIARLFVPPAVLNFLSQLIQEQALDLPALSEVICAGEALTVSDTLAAFFDRHPHCQLWNHYGPTETHVVTTKRVDPVVASDAVAIGQILPDCAGYILNSALTLLPSGAVGELYISGAGLSSGYIDKQNNTFISNPFYDVNSQPNHHQTLYKTGDRVCRLINGDLLFLGRVDNQVKLRGFRIELAEIEQQLLKLPQVDAAVVVITSDQHSEQQLVAYVTTTTLTNEPVNEPAELAQTLRSALATRLPDYMVPHFICWLAALPLTNNGKIDKQNLPAPEQSTDHTVIKPKGEVDIQLAQIWADLLKMDIEQISADCHFFRVGGHSLLATRLVAAVEKHFNVELSITDIFELKRLSAIAEKIHSARPTTQTTQTTQATYTQAIPVQTGLPVLSYAQTRLCLVDQIDGGSPHYNMPTTLRLNGPMDSVAIEQALNQLIDRHQVLRTQLKSTDQGFEPLLMNNAKVILRQVDLQALSGTAQQQALTEACDIESNTPFDLGADVLLRASFIRLAAQQSVLILNVHHVAADGWSIKLLIEGFFQNYHALLNQHQHLKQHLKQQHLAPLPVQYADYAHWQRNKVEQGEFDHQLQYWLQQLTDLPECHSLPLDLPRPPQQSFHGATHTVKLDPQLTAALKQLADSHQVSLFMVLHGAFALLLSRHGHNNDIVMGTPVANRRHADLDGLIGFFVNTLLLRLDCDGGTPDQPITFAQFLARVRQVNLDAQANQDWPFELLVEKLNPQRSAAYPVLFQILFAMNNTEQSDFSTALNDNVVIGLEATSQFAKFDLSLFANAHSDAIELTFEYNTSLFYAKTIAAFSAQLLTLLQNIVTQPNQTLGELSLLSPQAQQQILTFSRPAALPQPALPGIHQLCEQKASDSPYAIALSFCHNGQTTALNYRQFNRRANQLARYLRHQGVGSGDRVGLCLPRGIEQMVALLAILKTGAAYVPLDISYPQNRLDYMLKDSGVRVLLSHSTLTARFAHTTDIECIELDNIRVVKQLRHQPDCNLALAAKPNDLAYVIYTSGSTGLPKGVKQSHQTIVNLVHAQGLTAPTRTLQFTPTGFDVSVQELATSWFSASCLVLIDQQSKDDLSLLPQLLIEQSISRLFVPPAVLNSLAQTIETRALHLPQLLEVISAGETLTISDYLADFLARHPNCDLWNHYGPSETHVVTTKQVTAARAGYSPTIGRVLPGFAAYVLDGNRALLPLGATGELYISGIGVSPGYIHQPELNQTRFINNPFDQAPTLYKTGDLVRYLDNAELLFLGRNDNQIKRRGFRIELAEVEQQLLTLPEVDSAVVIMTTEQQLVAYITSGLPSDDLALSDEDLRRQLAQQLPGYMIPDFFERLATLPLTTNGKIDQRALPNPQRAKPQKANPQRVGHIVPLSSQTQTQAKLAAIWADLLDLDPSLIGANSHFFDLGGHSLLAVRLINRLTEPFAVVLNVRQIFEHSGLSALALFIEAQTTATNNINNNNNKTSISKRPLNQTDIPLSFAQQRLWFIEQLDNSAHYHLKSAFVVDGPFNPQIAEQALEQIVKRHLPLRTCFIKKDGKAVQNDLSPVNLSPADLSPVNFSLTITDTEQPVEFDLTGDLMLKAHYLPQNSPRIEDSGLLVFHLHHIACDGWSLGILVDEFCEHYQAIVNGQTAQLKPLTIDYFDYSLWQQEAFAQQRFAPQLAYWQQQLAGLPQVHGLLPDNPRPAQQTFAGAVQRFELGVTLSEKLRQLASSEQVTLFMLLHSAFAVLLARHSGEQDIVVGTPVANRSQAALEPLIGFFVNMLLLRVDCQAELSFQQLLQQVKTVNLDAQSHQDIPFEYLVEVLNPVRNPAWSPLFQVLFNMDQQPSQSLKCADITLTPQQQDQQLAKFELSLSLTEKPDRLDGYFEYNSDLFNHQTITRLIEHFTILLNAIVMTPQDNIHGLALLPTSQSQVLNGEARALANTQVIEQFEQQAKLNPDSTALVFEGQQLSYQQLNQRANQLARRLQNQLQSPLQGLLQNQSIEREPLVAVCFGHSIEQIVSLLAIFKAGAAYLPIDPDTPQHRIDELLKQSDAKLMLTDGHFDDLNRFSTDNLNNTLNHTIKGSDLAYVIYTSGSTGKPKGVQLEHRSLANVIDDLAGRYGIDNTSRVLQFVSPAFDVSLSEILMSLTTGATLVLANKAQLMPGVDLAATLRQHQITHLSIVASALSLLNPADLPALQTVIVGGESSSASLIADWSTNCHYFLAYGPTEAAICSSTALYQTTMPSRSIGQPIANTTYHILDHLKQPVPVNCPGELYISGAGVARGYVNQPALTANSFVTLEGQQSVRAYKTGDLVRLDGQGHIHFIGRVDDQVKIRGHRIEPAEVSHQLTTLAEVDSALVLSQGDHLVGYVVAEQNPDLIPTLKAHLAATLPAYMVPTFFVQLDQWPLTNNGKIDKQALPPADLTGQMDDYQPPKTDTECLLVSIWSALLSIDANSISTRANFFALGGHSLLSVRLAAEIRSTLTIELPIKAIFSHPQLSELATFIDNQSVNHNPLTITSINRAINGSGEYYAPSAAQQRLWFIDQLDGGSSHYNMPILFSVNGQLNTRYLTEALNRIIERHEPLRTCYKQVNGQPMQQVMTGVSIKLDIIEVQQQTQQETVQKKITEHFDLSQDLMLKASLIHTSDQSTSNQSILLLNLHHIAADGWSNNLLMHELSVQYQALMQGDDNPLAALKHQYIDYAHWQHQWFKSDAFAEQLAYWQQQLQDLPLLHGLALDKPRPLQQTFHGAVHRFSLSNALTQRLNALAETQQATLFMLLQTSFAVLLARYSDQSQSDIVMGIPVANRADKAVAELIGFFVNTLVLRLKVDPKQSFSALFTQARQQHIDAQSHQAMPIEQLVECLNPERSSAHSPLFQIMFNGVTVEQPNLSLGEATLSLLDEGYVSAKYDLSFTFAQYRNSHNHNHDNHHNNSHDNNLNCYLEYNTDLFNPETLQRMGDNFQQLLTAIVENPEQQISQLACVSATEIQRLKQYAGPPATADIAFDVGAIAGVTGTGVDVGAVNVAQAFEQTALKHPHNIAVVCQQSQLSYHELNQQANRLAHHLIAQGVVKERLVAVCVERSIDYLVAIIAITKAGGAYVPIDPKYPAQRIDYMLADSGAKWVLDGTTIQSLSNQQPSHFTNNPVLPFEQQLDDLAYVIYTSGSTGQPKGVMIEQAGLLNLCHWHNTRYQLNTSSKTTQLAGPGFDAAVWEIWPCLLAGGQLHIISDTLRSEPTQLFDYFNQQQISHAFLPTALLETLSASFAEVKLPALQYLLTGGEKLAKLDPAVLQTTQVVNHYGPTEVSVVSTSYPLNHDDQGAPPIGCPITNIQVYVLDAQYQPLPIGAVGELYLSGTGVARGYLNQPALTAQSFINAELFSHGHLSLNRDLSINSNQRLYKTGDLVRFKTNGQLEYMGRADNQVKIRGYRIELAEIEQHLTELPQVDTAVVIYGDNTLAAYVTLTADLTTDLTDAEQQLRQQLSARLPEFMIPAFVVVMAQLPLTANGKVDKQALPKPLATTHPLAEPPRNDTERGLANIWAELLDITVAQISIADNFFHLGGHSLLTIRLIVAIRQHFAAELKARDIFDCPTLQQQAEKITQQHTSQPLDQWQVVNRDSNQFVLSSGQQRLWFLDQLDGGSAHYNMPTFLRVSGDFDPVLAEQALAKIIHHHQVLRTRFKQLPSGKAVQTVQYDYQFTLACFDISTLSPQAQDTYLKQHYQQQIGTAFDLSQDLMLRAEFIRLTDHSGVLLLNMHHIAADGWSLTILLQQFAELYQGGTLAPLTYQYIDYAHWQHQSVSNGGLDQSLKYWQQQLADLPQLHSLPLDKPRGAQQTFNGQLHAVDISSALNPALVVQLKQLAEDHHVTLFMLLHAALTVLLSRYADNPDIVLGTPAANRDRPEVEQMIGFFVNTLVLRVDCAHALSFTEHLARVRQVNIDALDHQEVPFDDLVDQLQPQRSKAYSPLFQMMFNLVNPSDTLPTLGETQLTPEPFDAVVAKFDLTFNALFNNDNLSLVIEYNSDLFVDSTIAAMGASFEVLLQAIVAQPQQNIQQLALLTQQQKTQQLGTQTHIDYPHNLCLHQLFEQQVTNTPDHLALVCGDQRLSYLELNRLANRLAHRLVAGGVKPDTVVALCVERSVEMFVAVLAILKAGGAYLPLDPAYPPARLNYMLADSAAKILLSQAKQLSLFDVCDAQILELEHELEQALDNIDDNNLPHPEGLTSRHLAYVIYTSGSTGKPKGVLLEHQGAINLAASQQKSFAVSAKSRVLQFASLSFDAATSEWLMALSNGASLHVCDEQQKQQPDLLEHYLCEQQISHATLPPALLQHLDPDRDYALQSLIVAGEACDQQLAWRWAERFAVFNAYGPTETTVCASVGQVEVGKPLTIGQAIDNTQLLVVNRQLEPVPPGMAGELIIGGDGLARGYLNRADLTADAFVQLPDTTLPGRWYRSGDRVRQLADGQLQFIGRLDHQVKIRGFRIELGEIEQQLAALPGVDQAVVVLATLDNQGQSSKKICAYITSANDDQDTSAFANSVSQQLATCLPAYMLPSQFIVLAQLPLSQNGKVNRQALPQPDKVLFAEQYQGPVNEIEQTLVNIWAELLNMPSERLSTTANFFALGGDSILSIQVVARAKQQGIELSVALLFEHQTIAGLALHADQGNLVNAFQGEVTGPSILLPIQQQFLANPVDLHHFNQSVLLTVKQPLNLDKLTELATQLVTRHDSLRLRFSLDEQSLDKQSRWQADYCPLAALDVAAQVDHIHLQGDDFSGIEAIANQWHREFDLTHGPLFRFGYFTVDDNAQHDRLLIICHHLTIDGVSWRILSDDIERLLRGEKLTAKTSAYQQWGQTLADKDISLTLDYWREMAAKPLASVAKNMAQKQATTDSAFASLVLKIDSSTTQKLLTTASEAYQTRINELLLSALAVAVNRCFEHQSLAVDLEGHGRVDLSDTIDLSQTVGWFTTVHPLVFDGLGQSLASTICQVKDTYRQAPSQGIDFGLLQQAGLVSLEPEILFNYLGQIDQTVQQQGLISLAPESSGQAVSHKRAYTHAINFNGMVTGGQLVFDVSYQQNQLSSVHMQRFVDAIKQALLDIVEHCCQLDKRHFTVSDFELAKLKQTQQTQLNGWQRQYQIEDIYPATPTQQGLLFHSEQQPGNYISQLMLNFANDINATHLKQAWQQIIQRHGVYRTVFVGTELGQTQQLVVRDVDLPWQVIDLSGLEAKEQQQQIEAFRLNDKLTGFDITEVPLMRFVLWPLGDAGYQLLWSHHHALNDGWCLPIVFAELVEIYAALNHHRAPALADIKPYRDYIQWLAKQDTSAALAFWQTELMDVEEVTPLPQLDGQSNKDSNHAADEVQLTFTEAQTQHIEGFARSCQVTPNTLLQAAWALLLASYSYSDSVLFGTTVSGRPAQLDGVESMVGLFINTIPVKVVIDPQASVSQWLSNLHRQHIQRDQYSWAALNDIQRLGQTTQFNSLLVYENYPVNPALEQQTGLTLTDSQGYEGSHFDITVIAGLRQSLSIKLEYKTALYQREGAQQLLTQLQLILTEICQDSSRQLHQLGLTTANQRRWLQNACSQRGDATPNELTIHSLFEQQVKQTPDAIALICQQQQLSYRILNQQANRLAHYLRNKGVTTDTLVGLYMERSPQMIISILAILKAGGAYMPLDPDYPAARLQYLAADSGIKLLLTFSFITGPILPGAVEQMMLDEAQTMAEIAACSADDLMSVQPSKHHLAYVNYTSGSTGLPKGVLVEHQGVIRLVSHRGRDNHVVPLNAQTTFLQLASIAFDAATLEIWGCLLNGGRLVLYPHQDMDITLVNDEIIRHQVNTLWLTAALFEQWSLQLDQPLPLKWLLTGGDVVNPAAVKRVYQQLEQVTVINGYGPTENTTFTSCYAVDRSFDPQSNIALGYVVNNTQNHIIGKTGQPVPVGAVGELYTGGEGLARGYLNQPELTAERFVNRAVFGDTQQRLYRTGDLVRYRASGELEFVGRDDNQLKIRGYRVEPGEIETLLRSHKAIQQAVVIYHKKAQQLVAYFVATAPLSAAELKIFLQDHLPKPLTPNAFVQLTEWPLTTNGKLDRQALPSVTATAVVTQVYQPPTNALEQTLCQVWAELFAIEQVSRDDDFFELGGHSMLVLQLVMQLKKSAIEVSVNQVYQSPTIAKLANSISQQNPVTPVSQAQVNGYAPLLMNHHWFLQRLTPNHWNASILLELEQPFKAELLAQALQQVFNHHDGLRRIFVLRDGEIQQHFQTPEQMTPWWQVNDLSLLDDDAASTEIERVCAKAQTSLDIYKTLFQATYFDLGDGRNARLMLVIHRLLVDPASTGVFFEDLFAAYFALEKNQPVLLPAKTTSIQDWAQWQMEFAQHQALEYLPYWHSRAWHHYRALPQDQYPEALGAKTHTGIASIALVQSWLSADETKQLEQLASQTGFTVEQFLLGALILAYKKWSGSAALFLLFMNNGRAIRQAEGIDLSRTVGWLPNYCNILFDLNALGADASAAETLKQVQQQQAELQDGGLSFSSLKYLHQDENIRQQMHDLPDYQLEFTYLPDNKIAAQANPLAGLVKPATEYQGETEGPMRPGYQPFGKAYHDGARLKVYWGYCSQRFSEKTMQRFLHDQLACLAELMAEFTLEHPPRKVRSAHA